MSRRKDDILLAVTLLALEFGGIFLWSVYRSDPPAAYALRPWYVDHSLGYQQYFRAPPAGFFQVAIIHQRRQFFTCVYGPDALAHCSEEDIEK